MHLWQCRSPPTNKPWDLKKETDAEIFKVHVGDRIRRVYRLFVPTKWLRKISTYFSTYATHFPVQGFRPACTVQKLTAQSKWSAIGVFSIPSSQELRVIYRKQLTAPRYLCPYSCRILAHMRTKENEAHLDGGLEGKMVPANDPVLGSLYRSRFERNFT